MRRRRRNYKFTEKYHSKRAIAAFAIAAVLLILYVVFVYLAYMGDGGLSTYFGSAGVMAMLLSVISFIVSITSFGDEDSFQMFPRLALFTSMLSSVCWVGTYIMGFM